MKEYPQERLAAQPIGYWSGEAYRLVVGRIRAALAMENLTQPHWWTLNHVAGAPGVWSRSKLTEKLAPFDDLVTRGWLREDADALTLTEAGEAGRLRAKDRSARTLEQTHEGIDKADYVTAINVLRRMIANLGGDSDLPD